MARFVIKELPVICPADGCTDLFQHDDRLMTCNRCGHTFETPVRAEVLLEQVVLLSDRD